MNRHLFPPAEKKIGKAAMVKTMFKGGFKGSRTLVRPDISSNWQKVKLMSGRTKVLQFLAIFLNFDGSFGSTNMVDHSLKSILQINITNILHNFEYLDFAGFYFPI